MRERDPSLVRGG